MAPRLKQFRLRKANSILKSTARKLHLTLDLAQNKVTWGRERDRQFTHRWETAFLELLLNASRTGLTVSADQLQDRLRALGQVQAINRSQILRLVNSIKKFLSAHRDLPIMFSHPAHRATVGPWQVQLSAAMGWVSFPSNPATLSKANGVNGEDKSWPWARMLSTKTVDLSALRELLNQWMTSASFARNAENASALEKLPDEQTHPLSAETKALLKLRRATLLQRTGAYHRARKTAAKIARMPPLSIDPRHQSQAQFMLQRIAYDENPAAAWPSLLSTPMQPGSTLMACPQAMSDWHNLQALLLRRSILDPDLSSLPPKSLDAERADRHERALLHFESAIYLALSIHDWDRLHAYVDNLAFHLQKMIPLKLSACGQALDWYLLALESADKLGSGNDDVWGWIFLGEFWLDNEIVLAADPKLGKRVVIDDFHPSEEDYWLKAHAVLNAAGTLRQIVIAQILHFRWAQRCANLSTQRRIHKDVAARLEGHGDLRKALAEDGYAEWMPAIIGKRK